MNIHTTVKPHAPLRLNPPGTKQECPPSPNRSAVRSRRLDGPAVSWRWCCGRPSPSLSEKLPPSAKRGKTRPVAGVSPNTNNAKGTIHAECRSTIVQPSKAQEPACVRSSFGHVLLVGLLPSSARCYTVSPLRVTHAGSMKLLDRSILFCVGGWLRRCDLVTLLGLP